MDRAESKHDYSAYLGSVIKNNLHDEKYGVDFAEYKEYSRLEKRNLENKREKRKVTVIYSRGYDIYVARFNDIYDILNYYDEFYLKICVGGVVVLNEDGSFSKEYNTSREMFNAVKKSKENNENIFNFV